MDHNSLKRQSRDTWTIFLLKQMAEEGELLMIVIIILNWCKWLYPEMIYLCCQNRNFPVPLNWLRGKEKFFFDDTYSEKKSTEMSPSVGKATDAAIEFWLLLRYEAGQWPLWGLASFYKIILVGITNGIHSHKLQFWTTKFAKSK